MNSKKAQIILNFCHKKKMNKAVSKNKSLNKK